MVGWGLAVMMLVGGVLTGYALGRRQSEDDAVAGAIIGLYGAAMLYLLARGIA